MLYAIRAYVCWYGLTFFVALMCPCSLDFSFSRFENMRIILGPEISVFSCRNIDIPQRLNYLSSSISLSRNTRCPRIKNQEFIQFNHAVFVRPCAESKCKARVATNRPGQVTNASGSSPGSWVAGKNTITRIFIKTWLKLRVQCCCNVRQVFLFGQSEKGKIGRSQNTSSLGSEHFWMLQHVYSRPSYPTHLYISLKLTVTFPVDCILSGLSTSIWNTN